MGDAWFTGYADELARCLSDARACAEICEAYLRTVDDRDAEATVRTLAAPTAVARVLIELIDQPPQLVLAAVRLCRDLTASAAETLGGPPDVVSALRAASVSAAALLDAAR
jgi:hypothetical protein